MSRPTLGRKAAVASWIAQLALAAILGQTLFFKFTGAPEARWIFGQLGVEPWGRIGTGVLELVTVLLVLVPRTAAVGALLAVGTMGGAILAHLTVLGIEVQGDGGTLFGLALAALLLALGVLALRRREIPVLGSASRDGGATRRRGENA